jgi:septation ring formation regulator EzrA
MVEESVENLSQLVSNCQKTSKVLKSSSLALPDNSKSEISQLSFGQFSSADLSSLLEKHLALLKTKLSQMSALKQRTDKA